MADPEKSNSITMSPEEFGRLHNYFRATLDEENKTLLFTGLRDGIIENVMQLPVYAEDRARDIEDGEVIRLNRDVFVPPSDNPKDGLPYLMNLSNFQGLFARKRFQSSIVPGYEVELDIPMLPMLARDTILSKDGEVEINLNEMTDSADSISKNVGEVRALKDGEELMHFAFAQEFSPEQVKEGALARNAQPNGLFIKTGLGWCLAENFGDVMCLKYIEQMCFTDELHENAKKYGEYVVIKGLIEDKKRLDSFQSLAVALGQILQLKEADEKQKI